MPRLACTLPLVAVLTVASMGDPAPVSAPAENATAADAASTPSASPTTARR